MVKIIFQDRTFEVSPPETVLETLLHQDVPVPHSCKSGICQSCTMVASAGEVPEAAQKGLKEHQKQQGQFLACLCHPQQDLSIHLPDEAELPHFHTEILAKTLLSEDVLQLRLRTPPGFAYQGGQFINLLGPDNLVRSYSLASVPELDDFLELQVRIIADGVMSGWLANDASVGDKLSFSGPLGDCYLQGDDPGQPLLLVSGGTGLAPQWAVLRQALHQGHRGPIHLYHGSSTPTGLYLKDELQHLSRDYADFHYHPCTDTENSQGVAVGRPSDLALEALKSLAGHRVYICGHPALVKNFQRQAFLAGARLDNIHTDPYEHS